MSQSSNQGANLPPATRSRAQAQPNTENNNNAATGSYRQEPRKYIKGLSGYERLDSILKDMQEKHRWSLKDLIRHAVKDEPNKPYRINLSTRVRRVGEVLKEPEVWDSLSTQSPELRCLGSSGLSDRLRKELKQIGKAVPGLGEFDENKKLEDYQLHAVAAQAQHAAPELCQLLSNLMETRHTLKSPSSEDKYGPIVMICSILGYQFSPKKLSGLANLIGLYMQSQGAKRRALDLLTGFGVIPSSSTINRRRSALAENENGKVRHCSEYLLAHLLIFLQALLGELERMAPSFMVVNQDDPDFNHPDSNQTAQHEAPQEPSEHVSTTTGKRRLEEVAPGDSGESRPARPAKRRQPGDSGDSRPARRHQPNHNFQEGEGENSSNGNAPTFCPRLQREVSACWCNRLKTISSEEISGRTVYRFAPIITPSSISTHV